MSSARNHAAPPAGIRHAYSPELESLRGWAILLVFLYHSDFLIMGLERDQTYVSPIQAFITAGHTGVTLFFVLSAFLLSRPFLEEKTRGRRVHVSAFFTRRALRIMPLYGLVVIASVLICFRETGAVTDGLRALFFVNGFTGLPRSLLPFSAVWWSLATEAQFYLLLPGLGLCLRSPVGRAVGMMVLIGWTISYCIVVRDLDLLSVGNRLQLSLSVLGRAPAFLVGIAAAAIVSRHGATIRAATHASTLLRRGGSDLLLMITLLGLGGLLREVTYRNFFQAEGGWTAWHVPESLLWGVVVLLILLAPLRLHALISNRIMVTMGMLSYSLYLLHHPLLHYADRFVIQSASEMSWLGPLDLQNDLLARSAAILIALILSTALAAVTYTLVERPFLIRKAKIAR